jgi:hypothetical protein
MIAFNALKTGAYYDGFVWNYSKQKGVATMRWDGEHFRENADPAEAYPYKDASVPKWAFEPNMKGVTPR